MNEKKFPNYHRSIFNFSFELIEREVTHLFLVLPKKNKSESILSVSFILFHTTTEKAIFSI